MPKCPKCGEEIDYLKHCQSGREIEYIEEAYHHVKIVDQEFIDDGKVNDYECPKCNKVLFTDEVEAIAFLEGGTIK